MTYKCEGCEATFTGTPREAFDLGWDTPELFMSHCTCPNCPITVTAWWSIVVEHKTPTTEDLTLIASYRTIHEQVKAKEGYQDSSWEDVVYGMDTP